MKLTFCCPCLLGLEGLVAQELREMRCDNVRSENGRVLFDGDMQMAARVNINSRYAERVLILMKTFKATSFEILFQNVKNLEWEDFIGKNDEFPVSGSCLSSKLHSVPDCQAIIKKAVVERLKSKYGISWFQETGALYKIRFLIMKDTVSIMIDTTGDGLHKRGYRRNSAQAPIKETLAAAMVNLSRVRENVCDPFCGSGTILIEGAMKALNIAPGAKRRFVAQTWGDSDIWKKEKERAYSLVKNNVDFTAVGYDISQEAVELTLENAKKAGVISRVSAEVADITSFSCDGFGWQYGQVICNPPYGERLLDIKSAQDLYRTMGKVFEKRSGWKYTVISPDGDFEKLFGRESDKRRKLYNGMIPCQIYMYFKS